MFRSYTYKTVIALCAVVCCSSFVAAQVTSTQEYINTYKFAAMQEMKVYKIPASITLGQGILESASGNSKLARECNNHFGIKCRKNWTGTFCLIDDDAPNECFRGYPSAMESYRDHSLFLVQSSRYDALFSLPATDYKGWAEGLRSAGYATNPAYASTLSGIIEKYHLGQYDSIVLMGDDYKAADTLAQKGITVNGIPAVYAKAGQTPEDIADAHNLGAWEIYRYNDLKRGESLDPGEIVYLKPKRRKGTVATATVQEGQDMRDISQQYGIKLKQLYKKNHLKPGQQVKAGETLNLQKKSASTPQLRDPNAPVVEPKQPDPVPTNPKPKPVQNPNFHEVQNGESLAYIAATRGVSVADLKLWNNLDSDSLKPGQVLVLKRSVKASGQDSSKPGNTKVELDRSVKYHHVLKGETLYSISRLYNQPVDSIMRWNNLNGSGIKPGMELLVSSPGKKINGIQIPKTYTVQSGDTLYSISRKFGLPVADIKKRNALSSDGIKAGQVLVLQ